MISLYRDMAKLAGICYDELQKNKIIQEYLKKRQITQKTIDNFYLGAFPSDLRVLLKEFKSEFLLKNGILYNAGNSPFKLYPLIIPIWDVNNNFIGLGGRTLMSEKERKDIGYPKYKNSEYVKSNNLFGLNYAKQSIRDKNSAIIVEGYFDVISSHQAGLVNVIATSGTFLSAKQMLLLARYTENVKILFDNDEAGRHASKKYLERCAIDGVNLQEMFLPEPYKDLDEYIVGNKTEAINL